MSAGDWKDFYKAACEGDLALVAHHVDEGIDLDYAHPEFFSTALVGAIRAGQVQTALLLLERGANPTLRSEIDGMTPIEAARASALPTVEARLRALGAVLQPARPASWRRWWPFRRPAPQ
ncbi:MAG: ankyrin repeat domain-containing protein [Pseudomonadota bacterium]